MTRFALASLAVLAVGFGLAALLAVAALFSLSWAELRAHLPLAAGVAAAVALYGFAPALIRGLRRLLRGARRGGHA
jgi:uncharacterized membrane-anchored protein